MTDRPKCLDLFCGAGGAAMGLHRAGFDVVGIDIKSQPRYPFPFVRGDALQPPVRFSDFDLVWANPPCQHYMRGGSVDRAKHPDLLGPTRRMLQSHAAHWVIENVPGAPMRRDLVLCGSHFGLRIRRHRWFESDNGWLSPLAHPCDHRGRITGVYGSPHGKNGAWTNGWRKPFLPSDHETWSREMGIDWMNCKELTQAIPPAYSEWVGRNAMIALGRAVA